MAADQTTEFMYPQAVNQLVDTTANYAGTVPGLAQQTYANWYQAPLSTGQTPYQTQAWGAAMSQPSNQWLSPLQQAQNMYTTGATYDPNQMQQYLNPYVNDAANATMAQVNRNLTENILPGVNTTFTGQGQFGSSRNADFTNRAIRDTQQALAETLAKQNVANYQNAQQNYLDWAKMGQAGASGLAGIAGVGSNITQQGLTGMLGVAQQQQAQEQATLDKAYQDYLTRQQYPLSALQAISQATKNIGGTQQPNINVPVAQPDDISRALAAIQAMQAGLSDDATQALLGTIFNNGTNPFATGS